MQALHSRKTCWSNASNAIPNATTTTFTDAWISHYEPSPQVFPLVYFVNLFYKIFIPAVLGGMTLVCAHRCLSQIYCAWHTEERRNARMSNTIIRTYERFPLARRIEHLVMLLSFTTLGLTGLPQKFSSCRSFDCLCEHPRWY